MYYALRIALVLTLAAASLISFRSARADMEFRQRTPEAVARAVALEPGNTEYLNLRALQLDYEGADSTALLERAVELNPLSSAPRIRLGLAAETRGDFANAEKWLLDAARVDRQFEPRWTLANFYFRRDDSANFWTWMHQALEISYPDRSPAFDLCWRRSDDPEEIWRRAIPEQHEVIAAYLSYLLETRRPGAVAGAAMKLAAARDPGDRDLLIAACDSLIGAHLSDAAWTLWLAAGFKDVSFESPQIGRGFDWQRVESAGVVHLEISQPRSMHRITLNGNQAESCELLRRVLRLTPGRRYTLRWQAQPEMSGIEWRVGDEHAPLKNHQLDFTAPRELVTLTLAYQRPQGEVRAEGSLELWEVEVR
ncbi:MAG: hypothetical protein LAO79_25520 [Acidobacteriia bacterium]|nr:hypothetical protein [Terriglobia bacterium]